ncbi:serine/threonine-protein kinase RsbT [Allochromatium warmingii]|uniref:Serine/threonine-protein kinase RsbT n=1 Tax=Allochromatium warmingii TaxID=61595 RepID=A0A1H3BA37_ALLWA|nr:anti-sigma regulatory factor [Allochromatium warmingii]SDX38655.1 serine/threonine-protein kinase RsbT [Allochromatium warmingii]
MLLIQDCVVPPPLHWPTPYGYETAVYLPIHWESDVMAASRQARQLAERLGFSRSAAYHIATAASELANNARLHAGGGWLYANALFDATGETVIGLELIVEDSGPGIADPELALTDGYSTGSGLGCGLPGVKRLMDAFSLEAVPSGGVRVRAIKWR